MKLFNSPNSPFGRKVMVCAMLREIDRQIEQVPTMPSESPAELFAANPLGKIPCLITSDGRALFDSPVICEFLDSIGDAPPMFPPSGGPRWKALKQQAVADGLLDAAILCRQEQMRPEDAARVANIAKQKAAMGRALDLLEFEIPHRGLDIGTIAIVCAIDYMDMRHPDLNWRATHPVLAAWYAAIAVDPVLVATAPKVSG